MSSPRGPKGLRDPNSRKAIRGGPGNTTTSKHAARPYVENSLVEKPFMTANSAAQKRTPKLGRLLIAIDLGTTRVAVATKEVLYNAPEDFKKSKEHLPRVFCHWPASSLSGDYRFPSTSIYYNHDGGLPITGNDLTLLVEDPSFEPQRLIRQLKMLFHDANKNATTLEMQARIEQQLQVVGKTSDEALHDLAQVVLEHLFHDTDGNGSELGKLYDHLERLDYELIIAVPPGRSTVDHARVRQAFVQGPIKSTAVFVESEPAAMFRSWVHDGQITRDWAVGKSFVIADIGGGTCCIVRLKLERLEPRLGFKQEFESQSIPFGAETISDAFLKKANSRVPEDWPDRDIELAKIRNRFESVYKRGFGRKPLNGMKMERTGTRNQWWEFSFDDLKACFDVCIKELVNGLEKEMKRGPMDYLVLGGGLADNHYVREYITNHFKGVKIRELSTGKEHVVVGSILARLDEDFIVDFPIVRSKAVTQWLPVTDEIEELSFYHRLAVKPSPTDPDAKYVMAAKWLVKKGTQGARVQNISSEDNIDDAKERHLHPNNKTPKFSETILTFNYDPGDDEWAFEVDGDDDIWVNQDGETIPSPEHEEKITWSPWSHEHSFEFNDLDDAKTENGGTPYKVLRYSIEMKVTETLTSTWAKIWSSEAMRKKNNSEIAFRSDPISLEPIFTAQNVSRSLKESFDMDNQARSARCGKENINAKQLAFKSAHKRAGSAQSPSLPRSISFAKAPGKSKRLAMVDYNNAEEEVGDESYRPFSKRPAPASGARVRGTKNIANSTPQKRSRSSRTMLPVKVEGMKSWNEVEGMNFWSEFDEDYE